MRSAAGLAGQPERFGRPAASANHLRGVEGEGLADDAAPALVEGLLHHLATTGRIGRRGSTVPQSGRGGRATERYSQAPVRDRWLAGCATVQPRAAAEGGGKTYSVVCPGGTAADDERVREEHSIYGDGQVRPAGYLRPRFGGAVAASHGAPVAEPSTRTGQRPRPDRLGVVKTVRRHRGSCWIGRRRARSRGKMWAARSQHAFAASQASHTAQRQ